MGRIILNYRVLTVKIFTILEVLAFKIIFIVVFIGYYLLFTISFSSYTANNEHFFVKMSQFLVIDCDNNSKKLFANQNDDKLIIQFRGTGFCRKI